MPVSLLRLFLRTSLGTDSVGDVLAGAASVLKAAGIETPQLDAALLLAHTLGMPRERLLLEQGRVLNSNELSGFEHLVLRRSKHEPVAYIIEKKEFWSLDFIVTYDTLIPRPDSEILVEAALKRAKNIAHTLARPLTLLDIGILDIGVGTGCLLIALLRELPSAQGLGVDVSVPALDVAGKNARTHGVLDRVQFIKSNWCDKVEGKFDMIISNPPYIPRNDYTHLMKDITDYEPYTALVSGEDGLDSYRAISRQVGSRLKSGGYVLFEIGQGQAEAVAELLHENNLAVEEIKKDLAGVQRCVIARKMN